MKPKSSILYIEIVGIFFIFITGSLLHFVFEWSGQWKPLAIIAAVNESVWEHLKLAFWPALIFALLSFPFLKKRTKSFWIAKAAGLYVMPIVIIILFYLEIIITGESHLWYDILVFFVAIGSGQLTSWILMSKDLSNNKLKTTAFLLLIILFAAFCFFTFFPPKFPLFRDFVTGKYGIIEKIYP